MRRGAALVALALFSACGRPAPVGELRRWQVDPEAEGPEDGSGARPFRTLSRALDSAGAGEVVELRPGRHEGRVRLSKPVVLTGPAEAVLSCPGGDGVGLEVLAPAWLSGFSVEGCRTGVRVSAPAVLERVRLSGHSAAALEVAGGAARVIGARIVALNVLGRPVAVGIEVAAGAGVDARELALEGPFRFGIRARGARLQVARARVVGATVGIVCSEGCEGRVEGSLLEGRGAGAGLVAGDGARLSSRENLLAGWEQCLALNPGASLETEDDVAVRCAVAGVASVRARLRAVRLIVVGPTSGAAVQVVGGRAEIEEGLLLDPGPVGVDARMADLEVRGTLVRGARPDREGDFGDGLHVFQPDGLRLRSPFVEDCQGAGLAVSGGAADVAGLEARGYRVAGVEAFGGARVTLDGARLDGAGPAISALEGSRVRAVLTRLGGRPPWVREPGSTVEEAPPGFAAR